MHLLAFFSWFSTCRSSQRIIVLQQRGGQCSKELFVPFSQCSAQTKFLVAIHEEESRRVVQRLHQCILLDSYYF